MDNKEIQFNLPLIERKVNNSLITQRVSDGYINATALCKACDKLFADYQRLESTKEFLIELSSDMGIPISELVQIIKGGNPKSQGTWVHPRVAINLAQWANPVFAANVTGWVMDWMQGSHTSRLPYHLRRYLVNRLKIPNTHFSMLDQITLRLLGSLEDKGYILPDKMMPDISLGRMFSKWLRDNGYDPDSFPTYTHEFVDNKRPPVKARLYPNEMLTKINQHIEYWVMSGKALKYFAKRDPKSIESLEQVAIETQNRLIEYNKSFSLNSIIDYDEDDDI